MASQFAYIMNRKLQPDSDVLRIHILYIMDTFSTSWKEEVGDWSSELVFTKFYYKPLRSGALERLSSPAMRNKATNYHSWYVRRSLLKYNYRMAQPTKWVPAILDYMKKVKSNISTSHPYPCELLGSIILSACLVWGL